MNQAGNLTVGSSPQQLPGGGGAAGVRVQASFANQAFVNVAYGSRSQDVWAWLAAGDVLDLKLRNASDLWFSSSDPTQQVTVGWATYFG